MADGGDGPTARLIDRIDAVPAADWDACAGADNPFVGHAFLKALEDSGSVGADSGWLPRHLVVEGADGRVIGAAPLYLKSHSFGEYVFDHGWADAYERAGGNYYPKLQCAVPFTPVPGPRLLVRPGADAETARRALIGAMAETLRQLGLSSLHVTFPSEADADALAEAGFLRRAGLQFHWPNQGYRTFDDFLAALTSRKRKAVRKERRAVAEAGITLHRLVGDAIRPDHWDAFHRFYLATSHNKWGHPYLTRDFFDRLGDTLADRVLLVMAETDGNLVAGALNLIGADALYGRNWGCEGAFKFLHFETCYYQAIDFAIEHGLGRVEAGAQGPHKVQRGYLPEPTHSAHLIADPRLRDAIGDYLDHERAQVTREIAAFAAETPYRQAD